MWWSRTAAYILLSLSGFCRLAQLVVCVSLFLLIPSPHCWAGFLFCSSSFVGYGARRHTEQVITCTGRIYLVNRETPSNINSLFFSFIFPPPAQASSSSSSVITRDEPILIPLIFVDLPGTVVSHHLARSVILPHCSYKPQRVSQKLALIHSCLFFSLYSIGRSWLYKRSDCINIITQMFGCESRARKRFFFLLWKTRFFPHFMACLCC